MGVEVMARIRSIKPQFWTSEQIADCSSNARLLFIGLWNFCDDCGVHPASPARLTDGDPVSQYLQYRTGINAVPACIRSHPALPYRQDDGTVTTHPAMLAKVQAADGSSVAIHRTYLTDDGQKAAVPTVKKILGSLPPSSAVRLSEPSSTLGVAEGIDTTLAAFQRFRVPTWAAISAGGLEKWTPPAGTEFVVVFGDNDESYTGQAAAFVLAKRLTASGIKAEVQIPELPGNDWNDQKT